MKITKSLAFSLFLVITLSVYAEQHEVKPLITQGPYEIYNKKALQVLDLDATIETLASGFDWLEGPVWVNDGQYLLFSDIPTHRVYRYQEGEGVQLYLAHSGYSNGLLLNQQNELVLLQSRSRQVVKMAAPLTSAKANYQQLVSQYKGQRLNSPNDGVFNRQGQLFFTDPPYGLAKQLDDPAKELNFQGVYSLTTTGQLQLLDKTLIYPNGIALSKDESTLYVAASNPQKPAWYQYKLHKDGTVINKTLLHQLPAVTSDSHGLPDGLKIHTDSGIIFATGPNGLWLFDEQGTLLARVRLPHISANLAFNAQQNRVYITAHQHLLALSLKN